MDGFQKIAKIIVRLSVFFVLFYAAASVGQSFINHLAEPLRNDVYNHIPNIHAYDSSMTLKETMPISTRTPYRAIASCSYQMTAQGKDVLSYYEKAFLADGWKRGINAGDRTFYTEGKSQFGFHFYKDNISLSIVFLYPLDKSPDEFIYGTPENYRYVVTLAEEI